MIEQEIIMNTEYTRLSLSNIDNYEKESKEISNTHILKTDDFLSRFTDNTLVDMILPKNCRYVKRNRSNMLFIIEEPPSIRTVRFDTDFRPEIQELKVTGKLKEYNENGFKVEVKKGLYELSLAFPYIIYFINVEYVNSMFYRKCIYIYYRLSPITSFSDYLLATNLLNIGDNNDICLGDWNGSRNSIQDIYNFVTNSFWGRNFNRDITSRYKLYEKNIDVGNPFTWAYNTKKDPSFIFNVDWVKENYNIGTRINQLLTHNPISINYMINLFDKSEYDEKKSDRVYEYCGSCTSVYLKDGVVLSVGDEITYNDKKYYVYSFITSQSTNTIISQVLSRYKIYNIKLEDSETSEIIEIEFDENKLIKLLENKEEIKSINIGDQTISVGDIILLDPEDHLIQSYNEVKKIRLSKIGNYEVLMGPYSFLAKNLKIVNKLNVDDIKIDGFKINKKDDYLIAYKQYRNLLIYNYQICKYKEFLTDGEKINCVFESESTGDRFTIGVNIPKENRLCMIIDKNTFSDSNYMFFGNCINVNNKYKIDYKNKIILSNGHGGSLSEKEIIENHHNFINDVISEDCLCVKGVHNTICFNIGDLVVISDWKNPEEMFNIRYVTGFEVDYAESINNESIISIITNDSSKNSLKTPYINLSNNRIYCGKIRKVSLEYNGIKAGSKIRAKEKGIKGFPKKDTNQIIAFLVDTNTNYPLMLCSNYLTLWVNDKTLNDFEIIEPNSKLFHRLKINDTDPNKIPNQYGDFYYRNWQIYHYNKLNSFNQDVMRFHYCLFDTTGGKIYLYDKSFLKNSGDVERFGFLEPRLANNKIQVAYVAYGMPDYHGGYFLYDNGPFTIKKDWSDYV